jgi:DNA-binding ferritin-like protein (Dps family)
MKINALNSLRIIFLPLFVASGGALFNPPAKAQGPELQERVAELKESMAKNKMSLAQYTWVEQVNISLKGELKKQERFQVRLGPDGKPQKASLDPPAESPSGGRLKKHIVEKKKEEYKEYAERMKALAQQYVPPDKEMIQQAYALGNISIIPGGGLPSEIKLVFQNFVKPQDSMTLIFDKAQKQLLSLQIASYMDDPKDAMKLTVEFSRLPDGTSHVSNVTMDGVSKQLNIATQNSTYQHL